MGQIVVRDLDDRVIGALRERASLHGRSLEDELRAMLTAAARYTPAERVAIADAIRTGMPPQASDSTNLLRQDRNR